MSEYGSIAMGLMSGSGLVSRSVAGSNGCDQFAYPTGFPTFSSLASGKKILGN
jgi:hypothetical protein